MVRGWGDAGIGDRATDWFKQQLHEYSIDGVLCYQSLNMVPGEHLCIRALLGIFPAIHDMTSKRAFFSRTFHTIREALEVFKKVA